jgi:hypothetical protein
MMLKRKRSVESDDEESTAADYSLRFQQQVLVERSIQHCLQELERALKLVAGFERQKFSRRKTVAKNNQDKETLSRHEAEYKFLKVSAIH